MKTIENHTPIYDLDDGIEYSLGPEFGDTWNRIISHSPCGCARVVWVGNDNEVHNQEGKFIPPLIRIPDDSDPLADLTARVEKLEQKVFPKCTCSRCTGLLDIEEFYREPTGDDISIESIDVTPTPPPTPSDEDYYAIENLSLIDLKWKKSWDIVKAHSCWCREHHTIATEKQP